MNILKETFKKSFQDEWCHKSQIANPRDMRREPSCCEVTVLSTAPPCIIYLTFDIPIEHMYVRENNGPNQQPKVYFSIVFFTIIKFVNWSLQNVWQTNTESWLHRHAHAHLNYAQSQAKNQIQTHNLWMLIICFLLHPTWKREKEEKCQRLNFRQAGRCYNQLLDQSIYMHLLAHFQMNSQSNMLLCRLWHTD